MEETLPAYRVCHSPKNDRHRHVALVTGIKYVTDGQTARALCYWCGTPIVSILDEPWEPATYHVIQEDPELDLSWL